jgi:diacylglycerol kinase family enzyme
VVALKSDSLIIKIDEEEKPFIQADGELIGKGNVKISIVPKAFSFYSI